jgi:hypothetical protein
VNKVKIALAGLCMLSVFGLFVFSQGAAAQARGKVTTLASSALAQAATATPEAMMAEPSATPAAGMMEHSTMTPEAAMMAGPTATAEAAMMAQQPGNTMTHSNLPTTGGSDYSGLLALVAAAIVLLVSGLGLRRALASRK